MFTDCSSLLIVYEGCGESSDTFLGSDFHYLKANSGGASTQHPHQHPHQHQQNSSSSSSSNDFLMDDTQSLSTSPRSVDSGLECLFDSSGSSKSFRRLLRTNCYEYENSTDSTDSGVSGFQKRSATDSEDTEVRP